MSEIDFSQRTAVRMSNNILDSDSADSIGAMYATMAIGEDHNLLYEPTSFEDAENLMLGNCQTIEGHNADADESDLMLAAISTKFSPVRLERTVKAFAKKLDGALNGTGLTTDGVVIGKPRVAGGFATLVTQIKLSDGQAISILFHAPDEDPAKFNADDTLFAFIFKLNAKDVTNVVAPSGGMDISIGQATMVLSNLAEKNSGGFVARKTKNAEAKLEAEKLELELEELKAEGAALAEEAALKESKKDELTAQLATRNGMAAKRQQSIASLKAEVELASPVEEPVVESEDATPASDTKADVSFKDKGLIVKLLKIDMVIGEAKSKLSTDPENEALKSLLSSYEDNLLTGQAKSALASIDGLIKNNGVNDLFGLAQEVLSEAEFLEIVNGAKEVVGKALSEDPLAREYANFVSDFLNLKERVVTGYLNKNQVRIAHDIENKNYFAMAEHVTSRNPASVAYVAKKAGLDKPPKTNTGIDKMLREYSGITDKEVSDHINAISEANSAKHKAIKDKEIADKKAALIDGVSTSQGEFLLSLPAMQAAKMKTTLDKQYQYNGKIMTRGEHIESKVGLNTVVTTGNGRNDNEIWLENLDKKTFNTITKGEADYFYFLKGKAKAEFEAKANESATSPENDLSEPTQAQKEAGNYKKGKAQFQGIDIVIENPKGSKRDGVDPTGEKWETTLKSHYGDIVKTKGADGDKLDIFVGENHDAENAYIVDQVNEDGSFDEHKIMLGFDSKADAKKGYLVNYNDGWKGLGNITEIAMEDLKTWIKGSTIKPYKALSGAGASNKLPPVSGWSVKQDGSEAVYRIEVPNTERSIEVVFEPASNLKKGITTNWGALVHNDSGDLISETQGVIKNHDQFTGLMDLLIKEHLPASEPEATPAEPEVVAEDEIDETISADPLSEASDNAVDFSKLKDSSKEQKIEAFKSLEAGDIVIDYHGDTLGKIASVDGSMAKLQDGSNTSIFAIVGVGVDAGDMGATVLNSPTNDAYRKLEQLNRSLVRDMASSLSVIKGIDNGTEQGYDRSLFVNSITGKIKTQAKNGNQEVVDAALDYIEAFQTEKMNKPAVTSRNGVWKLRAFADDEFEVESEAQKVGKAVSAIELVASTHKDVKSAVQREDIGDIDFIWGTEGKPPTKSGKRKGAKGVAHIIEARMRKDGMSEDQAKSMLNGVARAVVTGDIVKNISRGDNASISITDGSHSAHLVKEGEDNAWLLTGWDEKIKGLDSDESDKGYDKSASTLNDPTLTRTEEGAESMDSIEQSNIDSQESVGDAEAFEQTPTGETVIAGGDNDQLGQLTSRVQLMIDNPPANSDDFDQQLDVLASDIESAGLMETLEPKLNEAADLLSELLELEGE